MGASSISSVWKPTVNGDSKKIQGSCEVSSLKLSAGGGAAFVSIYDSKDQAGANENSLRTVLDASTTDNDFNAYPGDSKLIFEKGVFAVCEQGGNFNPVVVVGAKRYTV